jgi:hypothetical protein
MFTLFLFWFIAIMKWRYDFIAERIYFTSFRDYGDDLGETS